MFELFKTYLLMFLNNDLRKTRFNVEIRFKP